MVVIIYLSRQPRHWKGKKSASFAGFRPGRQFTNEKSEGRETDNDCGQETIPANDRIAVKILWTGLKDVTAQNGPPGKIPNKSGGKCTSLHARQTRRNGELDS